MCFGGELPELGSDSAVSPIATLCPHGPFVATDSCLRDTVPWFCTKSICVHPQSTDIMKTWESSPCALPQGSWPLPFCSLIRCYYWGFPRAGDRLKGLNYVCEQEALLTLLPQDKTMKVPKLPQTPSATLVVGYFWDYPQVSPSRSASAAGLLYLHHHQPHTAR